MRDIGLGINFKVKKGILYMQPGLPLVKVIKDSKSIDELQKIIKQL